MNSQFDLENSKTYMDYLQAASSLQKESSKKAAPYSILGAFFLFGGFSSIFWAGYKAMANCMFWGIVLGILLGIIGIVVQNKWLNEESTNIAHRKSGFSEFFKLYRQRYWPKEMVTGKKYDKFLELIGRKESV